MVLAFGDAGYLAGRDLETTTRYSKPEVAGLSILVAAGCVSGFTVWLGFIMIAIRTPQYHNTHVVSFFCSLLLANLLQAAGTAMNAKWALEGRTQEGDYCRLQGGLKQAGNVGMALWTFALSAHLFTLLFLRWKHTRLGSYLTLATGWFFVAFIVSLGPIALQDDRGAYFAPTGLWCWISSAYPAEQMWMEYFFEFLSAGLSLLIYTLILLRVRGNLYRSGGAWFLRFVPAGDSWKLAIQRDLVDASMFRVAARVVWFPVVYTVLLLPMAICRFLQSFKVIVPYWVTIITGTVFNLQGFVNILLLLITTRVIPDLSDLPDLTVPRRTIDMSSSERYGITPFILPPRSLDLPKDTEAGLSRSDTMNSTTPMIPLAMPTARWSLMRPASWRRRS